MSWVGDAALFGLKGERVGRDSDATFACRQLEKEGLPTGSEGGREGVEMESLCVRRRFSLHHARTFLALDLVAALSLLHGLERGGDEGPRLGKLWCCAGDGLQEGGGRGGGCRRSERGDKCPPGLG